MVQYTENQKSIAEKIDTDTVISNWKNWKWQLKHSIQDIDTFEHLLDIKFPPEERKELEKH